MLLHSATISPDERINRYGGKNEIMDVAQSKDFNDRFLALLHLCGIYFPHGTASVSQLLTGLRVFMDLISLCKSRKKWSRRKFYHHRWDV